MAELDKSKQSLRIDPCMNGWSVMPLPFGGNLLPTHSYVFVDVRYLGDFVAEWYREPERVATNRGQCEQGETFPDPKYKSKYDPGRFFSEAE